MKEQCDSFIKTFKKKILIKQDTAILDSPQKSVA